MNDVTIIILGATGDLTKRKLLPALYRLIEREKLNKFLIIGAAIEKSSAPQIMRQTKPFILSADKAIFAKITNHFFYHQLRFDNEADFGVLAAFVASLEKEHAMSGNRVVYLAAAAEYFCSITQHLATSKLVTRRAEQITPWQRIVYEKPFGHDLHSAQEINACIKQYFEESQIYRIDHFLTKELVSNIALVRFTNCVFEPLWNNRYIDQVQILISEEIALEGRGAYYDRYGALSDVIQNHMLELLALIAMESPEKLSGNYVRSRRANVLKEVQIVDGILGQYEGYTQEKNVAPHSTTETFAALLLRVNNARWAGVPFYVKTGKCLGTKETVIHIKFKQVDCLLTYHCPVPSNWLTIEVSPEATFSLSLNAKKPGYSEEVVPVAMEFCHSCLFGEVTPQSYEVVLEEVMRGEQSISVRFDEIEYAWQIIDAVRAKQFLLYRYACESNGPKEMTEFEQKHGMRWRS